MIVSHKYRIIICNPTKTGTETLQSLCTRKGRATKKEPAFKPFAEIQHPRHGMRPGLELRRYRAFFVCRNPYERLVSIFKYTRRDNTRNIGKAAQRGWKPFVDRFVREALSNKPSRDWGHNMVTQFKTLRCHMTTRVEVVKMEEFESFRELLISETGHALPELPHNNRGKVLDGDPEEFWDSVNILRKVDFFVAPDCGYFGYERKLKGKASVQLNAGLGFFDQRMG